MHLSVGAGDGETVGSEDGCFDGAGEGAAVGSALGSGVGCGVGPSVGDVVGSAEGALRSMAAAPVESCQSLPNRSLGSLRVGTIHVQAPTPHAPPLQAFLAEISQQTKEL